MCCCARDAGRAEDIIDLAHSTKAISSAGWLPPNPGRERVGLIYRGEMRWLGVYLATCGKPVSIMHMDWNVV